MATRYNAEFPAYALQTAVFSWAVYNFSNGHFSSKITSIGLPFVIRVACDTTQRGRSLFGEFTPEAKVFSTGNDFLNHIQASGVNLFYTEPYQYVSVSDVGNNACILELATADCCPTSSDLVVVRNRRDCYTGP